MVSVVIPARNAEKTIKESVLSALNQTHQEVEVIVIDDNSTDKTMEVLKSFEERIIVLRGQGIGSGPARNLGVEASSGEIIAFLDADDIWKESKLSKQLPLLESGVVVGTYASYFVDTLENQAGTSIRTNTDEEAQAFVLEGRGMPMLLSSILMNKSDFLKLGGFDPLLIRTQDYDLLVRACVSGLKIRIVREQLLYYRLHLSSETVESYKDQYLTAEYIRQRTFSGVVGSYEEWKVKNHSRPSLIRKYKAGALIRNGMIHFYSDSRMRGILFLVAGIFVDPLQAFEKMRRQSGIGLRRRKK